MKDRKKKTDKKISTNVKLLSAALMMIAICFVMVFYISNSTLAVELEKTVMIPTENSTSSKQEVEFVYLQEMKTVNYQIKDEVSGSKKETPRVNELSRDTAAKNGMALIKKMFGTDLEDAVVYMEYSSGTDTFQRAFWSGDIRLSGEERKPDDTYYTFKMDAMTGEAFDVCYERQLKEEVSLDSDKALAKDYKAYSEVAGAIVKKLELLEGDIVKTEYNCQGYSGNDPDISFDIYGKDGKQLLVVLSRFDKQLKEIEFNAQIEIKGISLKKYEEHINESTEDAVFVQIESDGEDDIYMNEWFEISDFK